MIILRIILLFVVINIGHIRAIETVSLVIDNSAEVKMENLLIEFMTDLKKFGSKTLHNHRLIVLGKDGNILQATKVVLENSMPYFVSTEAEAMILPAHFGAESVVLIFIDGFSEFEMNSVFAKLPSDYKCRTLIISMRGDRTDKSIASTILSAVKMKLRNVMFARFDGQVMRIYGRIQNANCEQEVTLLNKWIPKKGFSKNRNVLGHDLMLDERGCPVFVSTFKMLPTMIIRENENKSLYISGGSEGHLVRAIARYLNMVPVVKVPSAKEKFLIQPGGIPSGIIADVAREATNFGIGQIRPTAERARVVDFTMPYGHECIVWTVPLRTKYKYSVVTSEFSPTTWIMVILPVSLCCGLVNVIPKLNIGRRSSLNVFDVIAMTLNYAIPRPPTGLLRKLFFLLYFNYSRIITIAYSTSLSSILTTTKPEPTIFDEEGILAAGLRTAGTQNSRDILADQISPNGTIAELINRYEVITSVRQALTRIADSQDIAYLRHRSTIDSALSKRIEAGKPVEFHSLRDCVISYHPVMVTPKGSRLTGEVNHIMLRVQAAGLHIYWLKPSYPFRSTIVRLDFNNHTLSRLRTIFILYLSCLIPAVLVFAAELIAFKMKLNWFSR